MSTGDQAFTQGSSNLWVKGNGMAGKGQRVKAVGAISPGQEEYLNIVQNCQCLVILINVRQSSGWFYYCFKTPIEYAAS